MILISLTVSAFIIAAAFNHKGPFSLYLYSSALLIFGFFISDDSDTRNYLQMYLLCNLAVLIGLALVLGRSFGGREAVTDIKISRIGVLMTFWVIFVVIFLHYVIVGLPLLSGTLDVSRFQVAASGFFGIPSRFATYMPSLMFIIFYVYRSQFRVGHLQMGFMIAAIVFSILASGHKSALLQMVFIMLLLLPFGERSKILKISNTKIIFLFSCGLGFAGLTFYSFNTLSEYKIFDYLVARYSSIMHGSALHLFRLDDDSFNLFGGNAIINDTLYPLLKFIDQDAATLNTQLSADFYGVPDSIFTVPVTPGFYAYHAFILGSFLSVIAAFTYGVFIGFLYKSAFKTSRPCVTVVNLFLVYWLYVGYTSGNLYYLIVNISFCIGSFLFLRSFFGKVKPNIYRGI